ncbi:hypothetical protein SAMN05444920_102520 [Nonomuraea solani]|uniref:Uncharacterized protein n=1 Tax=Nonomuraea solani TaxID=1144553 RepID=A0A1H5Z215_9ACTN|nr:hypothetical protein [Nonomuraea solani]SEG30649.1 hypothetical protein SAMN05444920_102520 [Nonomuraea solani]
MPLLHTVGISVGCVLALAPALLPSVRPARRWPHVVMAAGMAAGHLGGLFLSVAVLALVTAGWLCGSPSRRAETGHHIPDFVVMALLLVLMAFGGPDPAGGHAHAGGMPAALALVIGLAWTCARLVRVLPGRGKGIGQDLCSAGMAASMAFMAALSL